jgi:hypothetical protein
MNVVPLVALLSAASPVPPSPEAVVRQFYAVIIKHHPLGLPTGPVKRELMPYLSARLSGVLVQLQACEDDYYRRYRRRLEAEQLKPSIGWLEEGLFSGGSEEAIPAEVVVSAARRLPDGRLRAEVEFTYRDTYETYGRPPDPKNTFKWRGAVVLAQEGTRYLIDDYVPIDHDTGTDRRALSQSFDECRGGRWVGKQPY